MSKSSVVYLWPQFNYKLLYLYSREVNLPAEIVLINPPDWYFKYHPLVQFDILPVVPFCPIKILVDLVGVRHLTMADIPNPFQHTLNMQQTTLYKFRPKNQKTCRHGGIIIEQSWKHFGKKHELMYVFIYSWSRVKL